MERYISEVISVARSRDRKFMTILNDIELNIRLIITRQDLRRIVLF